MHAMPKSDAAALNGDPPERRLRLEVYDALAAKKGVRSVAALAVLHGIHRATLFRIRSGERMPRLELAMRMAADLGTTVEALFERRPD